MPHHLRYQSSEWALHHVVSRCLHGFSFLKSTPVEVVEVAEDDLSTETRNYRARLWLGDSDNLLNQF